MKIALILFFLFLSIRISAQNSKLIEFYSITGLGVSNTFYVNGSNYSHFLKMAPLFSFQAGIGAKLHVKEALSIGFEPNFIRRAENETFNNSIFYSYMFPVYIEFEDPKNAFGLGFSYNLIPNFEKLNESVFYDKSNASLILFLQHYFGAKLSLKPTLILDVVPSKNVYAFQAPYNLLFKKYTYNVLFTFNYIFAKKELKFK
jgi:hypothetical protein